MMFTTRFIGCFRPAARATRFYSTTATTDERPIISFIGGGNMSEAILVGLGAGGHPASRLRYSEPLKSRREYLQAKYPDFVCARSNKDAVADSNVVVLAVKPQIMRPVVTDLGPSLLDRNSPPLIISIASGITTEDVAGWLKATPDTLAVVRCMPNTPALIGEGAVGLYSSPAVNPEQCSLTESIMRSFAKQVRWVPHESLIEAVVGVSGSGPAYFFLIMEAMQDAGVAAGLSAEAAKALTLQTCLGAARMAQESEDDLATLRRKVTSPKGTTEAAIRSMEESKIREIIHEAIFTAERRGREIAEELRKQGLSY